MRCVHVWEGRLFTTQLIMIVMVLLLWSVAAQGQDNPSNPFVRSDSTPVSVAYEGALICFRCDITPCPKNHRRCEQAGHVPLFKSTDGHLHKRIGSTNSITAKLASDELHSKKVKIKGLYYTKTDHVLVEAVTLLGRSSLGLE